MFRKLSVALLMTAFSAGWLSAAEIRVQIPSEAADIAFELKATMHTVHGTARLEHADFILDTETGSVSGEAVVASASADTDSKKRDKKMHSKVLLSDAHPKIVFKAERFEGEFDRDGVSDITLIGAMEIIGKAHPITVSVVVNMADGTAQASFTVPYVEWGLEDPSTFVLRVGKEVPVTVTARTALISADSEP